MSENSAKNDWRWEKLYPPCYYCKHLQDIGTQQSLEGWTCKAFPNGIPFMILDRIIKHDEEIGWQTGTYLFESKEYENDDGLNFISFEGKWHK